MYFNFSSVFEQYVFTRLSLSIPEYKELSDKRFIGRGAWLRPDDI